ncbi:hypothetical protein CROQUDRAFT_723140 [Cronartium quercuum f. sp. fusiforme G11]|uniref:Uncharacterized protein n=1 Tax=Cronartium quercuum f. sp. fusiforme G11 TaxID=708437 RepID=A0A9P6TB60_9BASI|nr:hypothetical protein CROQUDRAFT_723140 [Cronartium quercuum f. sp. fusiforme G11]
MICMETVFPCIYFKHSNRHRTRAPISTNNVYCNCWDHLIYKVFLFFFFFEYSKSPTPLTSPIPLHNDAQVFLEYVMSHWPTCTLDSRTMNINAAIDIIIALPSSITCSFFVLGSAYKLLGIPCDVPRVALSTQSV